MKAIIKNNIITLSGILLGALSGYLYWYFVGCATGTCPLTSNWLIMLVYGLFTGGLIGNILQDRIQAVKKRNKQQ